MFSYKHEIFQRFDACNKPKNPPRALHAHAVIECDHAVFAQMSDRVQVATLLEQFRETCDTAQQQAEAGAGAAAWQPVLADLCAKLPDLTVQDEVPPPQLCKSCDYLT